jgi:hypothetical protein
MTPYSKSLSQTTAYNYSQPKKWIVQRDLDAIRNSTNTSVMLTSSWWWILLTTREIEIIVDNKYDYSRKNRDITKLEIPLSPLLFSLFPPARDIGTFLFPPLHKSATAPPRTPQFRRTLILPGTLSPIPGDSPRLPSSLPSPEGPTQRRLADYPPLGSAAPMEPRVGNKYRLGRKLGSGSFGEIFLGLFRGWA